MSNTAFEAITLRQSFYAAAALPKYAAVMIDSAGKYDLSDGSRPFAGIVEYGTDAADEMATVVKGSYPALGNEDVTAGDLLTIDSTAPGKFKVADAANDKVYGVALTTAAKGDLFTINMIEVPVVVTL